MTLVINGTIYSVITTLGDIIYGDSDGLPARLPGNTTTTKKYLFQTGDGTNSAAPAWAQISAADLSDGVTGTGNVVRATSPTLSNATLTSPTLSGRATLQDSGTTPPLNATPRSTPPSNPSANDIYLDDGTNTASGNPGWRRYTGSAWEDISASTSSALQSNLLINGGFRVWQRGTSFDSTTTPANNDDTYLADRWILLSDGNDIVDVAQETTTVPTGAYSAIKLTVATANKQFGICQILEAKDAAQVIGSTASLSFYARLGTAGANANSLKAVVLAWNGTEDVVTSDVVAAWGASPTWATNWTAENTPSGNTLTDSWQRFEIPNISIDTASAKNVAVFIFCDDTNSSVGDVIYISNVKLESGSSTTDYIARPIADELQKCKRYYQRVITSEMTYPGQAYSSTGAVLPVRFDVEMRVAPSVTANVIGYLANSTGANVSVTGISASYITTYGCRIIVSVSSGLSAGDATYYKNPDITYDAEL